MLRIHLDTTFLMPFFNLETDLDNLNEQYLTMLEKANYTYTYSPVSIIEIKWVLLRLERAGYNRDTLEKQFSESLLALNHNESFKQINFVDSMINNVSYELMKMGHRDLFDTIIASSALWEADVFLTEDDDLKKRIQTLLNLNTYFELKKIQVMCWKEFVQSM